MITLDRSSNQGATSIAKGTQFLSPRHVTSAGVVMTVTKVNAAAPADKFGNTVAVYFSQGGNKFSKWFKPSSDGLAELCGVLGLDETKWAKKNVLVGRAENEDGGEHLTYKSAK